MTKLQKERALRRDKIKALSDKGFTYQEIANTFGVSRQRVQAILKKHYNVRRR